MSDRIDRILELIDGGLLDNTRQSSPEPAMPLDDGELFLPVRVHECGPECSEHAHLASIVRGGFAGWVMDHLGEETVYVRLHTSDPWVPGSGVVLDSPDGPIRFGGVIASETPET